MEQGTIMAGRGVCPKSMLGYVERSSEIVNLPVTNLQHQKLGKVWALRFDVFRGRVLSIIVIAPGDSNAKSVIPPMALKFNDRRDGLLLDDSIQDFSDEPQFIFTSEELHINSYCAQENYAGPSSAVVIDQGRNSRDVDITVRILRCIHAANITGEKVDVGTVNERVTLRGSVPSSADRVAIAAIAVACSRLELVDNQITVRKTP